MGKVIAFIQLEMQSAEPSVRPSAKGVAQRLMVTGNELSFFMKDGCWEAEKPGASISDQIIVGEDGKVEAY